MDLDGNGGNFPVRKLRQGNYEPENSGTDRTPTRKVATGAQGEGAAGRYSSQPV
jgi:hypothetical protein